MCLLCSGSVPKPGPETARKRVRFLRRPATPAMLMQVRTETLSETGDL